MPSFFPVPSLLREHLQSVQAWLAEKGSEREGREEAKTFPQKCNLDLTERLSVSGSETKRGEEGRKGDKEI